MQRKVIAVELLAGVASRNGVVVSLKRHSGQDLLGLIVLFAIRFTYRQRWESVDEARKDLGSACSFLARSSSASVSVAKITKRVALQLRGIVRRMRGQVL